MSNPTVEELQAQIAALQTQNAELKAKKQRAVTCKVSEKGAVSVYGLGRFPTTLYANQMTRLLDAEASIRQFIEDNMGSLSVKD